MSLHSLKPLGTMKIRKIPTMKIPLSRLVVFYFFIKSILSAVIIDRFRNFLCLISWKRLVWIFFSNLQEEYLPLLFKVKEFSFHCLHRNPLIPFLKSHSNLTKSFI